jgi:hypothetical protein
VDTSVEGSFGFGKVTRPWKPGPGRVGEEFGSEPWSEGASRSEAGSERRRRRDGRVAVFSIRAAQAARDETARDTSSRDGASRLGETTPRVLCWSPVRAGGRRRSGAADASKAQAGDVETALGVETGGCKLEGGDGRRCSSRRSPGSSWGDGRLCRDDAFGGERAPGREKPRRGNGPFVRRNSWRAGTDSRHVEPRGRARGSHDDDAAHTATKAP